ncbi:MAG: glycoside hydrolase family 16 protein, partial [Myxococcales bacterium]|nr:glycoside hydrolase family 16 protein [Myxococcales bacterium]
ADADADADPDADADADSDADAAADSAGDTADVFTGPVPGPVTVSARHWRLAFEDDFRGKTGAPSDDYCFDTLKPQCHVWAGTSYDCDLADIPGQHFFPPTRENLVAAVRALDPAHDFAALSDADVKALYGELIATRMRHLNKCTWTSYQLTNWMATDYAGHWSARFDPTRVLVDPAGKGTLELSAAYAPVDIRCAFGGAGGDPNCQVRAFDAGVLDPGTTYWADPDPRWPGVYYAQSGGACPHGGVPFGPNCQVVAFAPHFLEETGVAYWVDADPRWPGVYYANTAYACRENIDYAPTLAFRNLTCPIIDGGLMSHDFTNKAWIDDDGNPHLRGQQQKMGRFEVKARLPKGVGAFPAAWLMPESGGWPYDGGEIDILEARDNADEAYQTYHHGKCYDPATNAEITEAVDSADCAARGGRSVHLDKGYTTRQRATGELWQRDHLYSVEWTDDRLDYYVNNVHTGAITVGTQANLYPAGSPPSLAGFESSNFPTSPFYWILNHSTYVPPAAQAGFATQTFRIDYVRSYVACGADNAEYCPEGGLFSEGVGCVDGGVVRPSPCAPATRHCVNGGERVGSRCRAWSFDPGVLHEGVTYWADADPRWPGVYYAKIGGGCPYGGGGEVNCQLVALPADALETGVSYTVDLGPAPPGIYYTPDFDP